MMTVVEEITDETVGGLRERLKTKTRDQESKQVNKYSCANKERWSTLNGRRGTDKRGEKKR